jgi:hypothetical protein
MENWRTFDTLDGIDPRVKVQAFKEAKALYEVCKNAIQLKELLADMVYHQQRMLEKWSDGDVNVQNQLWRNLHESGNKAKDYLTSIKS